NIYNSTNKKETQNKITLYPEQTSAVEMKMENTSFFPMINRELKLQIGSTIKAYTIQQDEKEYNNLFRIPLSLMQKKKITLSYPIVAEQRGVARISEIRYELPHLLSFNRIVLRFIHAFMTEFILFLKQF